MKPALISSAVLAAAHLVFGHYNFPQFINNGVNSTDWQYIRLTANRYSNGPVTDITSAAMRCYELNSTTAAATSVANVTAGSTVGFTSNVIISHPGYLSVYMSAVSRANSPNAGNGAAWFKIYDMPPTFSDDGTATWPSSGLQVVPVPLPKSLPNGQYLIRLEHAALHLAAQFGGAQFYIACAQVNLTGGGSGSPFPKVAIPGLYTGYEPGLMINIYLPFTNYTNPGPAVWRG